MNLFDYAGKKVKIIDTDNQKHIGFVFGCTKAEDNDENEDSIDIIPTKNAMEGIELFESEIKSIEII